MKSRRDFLKTLMVGGALLGVSASPLKAMVKGGLVKITVLHTNDQHSHIDPFPANDAKYPGLGGFARRAAIIKKIREEEKNVLLFDGGDVFQGTPYFNFYGGEVEMKLMSEMGYDAMTIGNHEFDNGVDGIVRQLNNMTFPFISSNYDFTNTALAGKTLPYKIFIKDGVKVGVFGLGIELEGLVGKKGYGETKYLDPLEKAAEMSYLLKKELHCDLIICLSHLGLSYKDKKVSDIVLAKQSKNIDLIIGGHTHTFIDEPYVFKNSDKKDIIIAQVGWAGVKLGRIDFYLSKNYGLMFADAYSMDIGKKLG